MRAIEAWKTVKCAVSNEPEWWTLYLLGQHHEIYATNAQPRIKGAVFRLLRYFQTMAFAGIRYPQAKPTIDSNAQVLIYAGTHNQTVSLDPIIEGLVGRGLTCECVNSNQYIASNDDNQWQSIQCGWLSTFLGMAFSISRLPAVWRVLKSKDRQLLKKSLDSFLRVHTWSFYFFFLVKNLHPRLVLMSNDHSVENRALLNICRALDIKTAYVQHASVSNLFPALRFDYSFLDGEIAKITYENCEDNRCHTAVMPDQRHTFLVGVQKHLQQEARGSAIGVAVKHKNDIAAVQKALHQVFSVGRPVVIRWHPGASTAEILRLKALSEKFEALSFSDPKMESVSAFARRIGCLVAGNTGLHLEISICGVPSIYYLIEEEGVSDYYRFVANGLSLDAPDDEYLRLLLADITELKVNAVAIKKYSASFGTEWQGKEGLLVSGHIRSLVNGEEPESLWGYSGVMSEAHVIVEDRVHVNKDSSRSASTQA